MALSWPLARPAAIVPTWTVMPAVDSSNSLPTSLLPLSPKRSCQRPGSPVRPSSVQRGSARPAVEKEIGSETVSAGSSLRTTIFAT